MGLAAAALLYTAITAILFRDLLPNLTTHLYGDLGDPLLNLAILAWNARQVPLTDAWWNFPSFAPLTGVTAFTEHLLLTYPVASPIMWLTGNPVLAYNAVFLLAPPLNALAAFAFARDLTASTGAAFVAGLAFSFAPFHVVHLAHLQLVPSFGMPFTLLWLRRYLVAPNRRALAWFGVGWFVTALSSAYLLVFFPILAVFWCVWFVRPREWRRLIAPAIAAAIATLALAPLLWGYHVRQAAYGFARSFDEIRAFSADMVGLIGMYHQSVAWRGILPHDFEEQALFPGFTILALAVIAIVTRGVELNGPRHSAPGGSRGPAPLRDGVAAWSHRLLRASAMLTVVVLARIWTGPWGWHFGPLPLPPFAPYRVFTVAFLFLLGGVMCTPGFRRAWSRRDTVAFFGVAVVAVWLLTLGPLPEWSTPWRAIAYGPYWLLMHLPGVNAIRVPARAWLLATLCLAMLAGYGTVAVFRRYARWSGMIVAVLAAMIAAEGSFVSPMVEVPRPMRPGAIREGAVVLDLPIDEGAKNTVPQYRAVLGRYRTINGYSGYEPAFFYPLRRKIADMHANALDSYRGDRDLYVIIRPGLDPAVAHWVTTLPGALHEFDVDDARVYRLPAIGGVHPAENTLLTR